jgi:hypothetical protein
MGKAAVGPGNAEIRRTWERRLRLGALKAAVRDCEEALKLDLGAKYRGGKT